MQRFLAAFVISLGLITSASAQAPTSIVVKDGQTPPQVQTVPTLQAVMNIWNDVIAALNAAFPPNAIAVGMKSGANLIPLTSTGNNALDVNVVSGAIGSVSGDMNIAEVGGNAVSSSLPVTVVAGAGTNSALNAAMPLTGTAAGMKSGVNMVPLNSTNGTALDTNCVAGCPGVSTYGATFPTTGIGIGAQFGVGGDMVPLTATDGTSLDVKITNTHAVTGGNAINGSFPTSAMAMAVKNAAGNVAPLVLDANGNLPVSSVGNGVFGDPTPPNGYPLGVEDASGDLTPLTLNAAGEVKTHDDDVSTAITAGTVAVGTAGTPGADVVSIQGITSMTPVNVAVVSGGGTGGTSSTFGAASPGVGTAVGMKSGANMVPMTTTNGTALDVNVVAGGGTGGTSSSIGAAFPTPATAVGFNDGTNMQGGKIFDLDSAGGTDYIIGMSLRYAGSGGSVAATGDAANGLDVDVTRMAALPAGNNNIGDVDVASIAAGNANIGDVDVATIAAGDNNIGNMDVASIAAGNNNIGDVDANLQAGSAVVTNVYGNGAVASFTVNRPADSTDYADGDSYANSGTATAGGYTFTNACRASGGISLLQSMSFYVDAQSATNTLSAELWLFNQAATATNDNAVFFPVDADMANFIGKIPFTLADANGSTGYSYTATGIGMIVTCVGTANIRALIKVRNAYDPTNAETFRATANFVYLN